MDRKIRVGAVSYLNTKPLIYGFECGMMNESVELVIDYPANIATALINDDIDIGLVPVAIIPEGKNLQIISDYCISCDGEVASVCLFSEVPVTEIKTVLLDYQSKTSAALVKILLKEYWKIDPVFENAGIDFREKIAGNTAALVIGDRAFEQRKISAYRYDLGEAWKKMTGLPFVFAAWVSNKPVDEGFIKNFNAANEYGLHRIGEVIKQHPYDLFDLELYYNRLMVYRLDAVNRKGMSAFFEKISHQHTALNSFL